MASSGARRYTRFIPGEEITDATLWQFGDVAAGVEPLSPVVPAVPVATQEPPQVIEDPKHQEQLQQARDEAHAQGLAEGHAQAEREWRQRLDDYVTGKGREVAGNLARLEQAFGESLEGLQQSMAAQLLDLACDIARQVVRRELQADPQALLPVVREALATFAQESRPATVRLHPDDWHALESALREEFGAARVQWTPDPTVVRGGCSVECAGAVVDGSLETRWRRAIAALGLVSSWRERVDGN